MNKPFKYNMFRHLAILTTFALWGASHAAAATLEGTVQGLNCVVYGQICAEDYLDPHITAENAFVVQSADKSYYFLTNIERSVLAGMVAKKVRVTGKHDQKYNSVLAEKIEVKSNGSYKVTWSKEIEERKRWTYLNGR